MCLSLSPSLIPALVYSMASKCKSASSWDLLRFGASSSNLNPSHNRFRDEKTKLDFSKNFSENFSWRGIHLECQVILLDFSDTDLPTIIYSRG